MNFFVNMVALVSPKFVQWWSVLLELVRFQTSVRYRVKLHISLLEQHVHIKTNQWAKVFENSQETSYKIQITQQMNPWDLRRRRCFDKWMLDNFLSNLISSNKARFWRMDGWRNRIVVSENRKTDKIFMNNRRFRREPYGIPSRKSSLSWMVRLFRSYLFFFQFLHISATLFIHFTVMFTKVVELK